MIFFTLYFLEQIRPHYSGLVYTSRLCLLEAPEYFWLGENSFALFIGIICNITSISVFQFQFILITFTACEVDVSFCRNTEIFTTTARSGLNHSLIDLKGSSDQNSSCLKEYLLFEGASFWKVLSTGPLWRFTRSLLSSCLGMWPVLSAITFSESGSASSSSSGP